MSADAFGPTRLVGVELGGTKSIAVLFESDRIVARETMPTASPDIVLPLLRRQLNQWKQDGALDGLGIASFGPLQLDRSKHDFGSMLATPKPGWTGAKVATLLAQGLACPWMIDTDVNGAALAEYDRAQDCNIEVLCYITVGTGVGTGLVIGGQAIHGAMHPEVGHLRLRRSPGDGFPGACPFHGDCIEGLVSGPAIAARFGMPGELVHDDHPYWAHVASDLAELCTALLLTVSAERILFGGGVATHRPKLLEQCRPILLQRLSGYLPFVADTSGVERIVGPATLGTDAGPLGAIALARRASGLDADAVLRHR